MFLPLAARAGSMRDMLIGCRSVGVRTDFCPFCFHPDEGTQVYFCPCVHVVQRTRNLMKDVPAAEGGVDL